MSKFVENEIYAFYIQSVLILKHIVCIQILILYVLIINKQKKTYGE